MQSGFLTFIQRWRCCLLCRCTCHNCLLSLYADCLPYLNGVSRNKIVKVLAAIVIVNELVIAGHSAQPVIKIVTKHDTTHL